MPLYSEHIANIYYGGSPSYSAPYSSYSSVLPHGSSYSASYLNPGGSYSSHSSLGSYSRPPPLATSRWVTSSGRNYAPMLSTISERASGSPVRINSPRRIHFTKRNYVPPSYTPRPININTADIDVSKDKYRHKIESPTPPPAPLPEPVNDNGPFMPRVDGKPETGIDSSPGVQRSTIRRGRTVVRLHTIKRKDRDSPRKSELELKKQAAVDNSNDSNDLNKADKVNTSELMAQDEPQESLGWREKLSEELAYKDKRQKKTIGAKLVEKFIVKDKDSDSDGSFKEKKHKLQVENLPVTPSPTSSAAQSRSPDRRCSMEMLAEQANLLDSLIRGENLSTASLDLSKVGLPEKSECNIQRQPSIKRRKSKNQENPLQTTKSDYALHETLQSGRDPKLYTKRRSLKKSQSGGSIRRLDSITEFPKEPIVVDLPIIDENSANIKRSSVKPKPKIKAVITSTVEISPPQSPLKFKIDVTVEEKPRSPRKEIIYSTTVEEVQTPVKDTQSIDKVIKNYTSKKTKTLKKEQEDAPSPEPDDGNFWDKIGKRETVYLMKRKQFNDDTRERNRRALFWFPEDEEEESGINEEVSGGSGSSFEATISNLEPKDTILDSKQSSSQPTEEKQNTTTKSKNVVKDETKSSETKHEGKVKPSTEKINLEKEINHKDEKETEATKNIAEKIITPSKENTEISEKLMITKDIVENKCTEAKIIDQNTTKDEDKVTNGIETKIIEKNKTKEEVNVSSEKQTVVEKVESKIISKLPLPTESEKHKIETSVQEKVNETKIQLNNTDNAQSKEFEESSDNVNNKVTASSNIKQELNKKEAVSEKKEEVKKNTVEVNVSDDKAQIKKPLTNLTNQAKDDNICTNCGKITENKIDNEKTVSETYNCNKNSETKLPASKILESKISQTNKPEEKSSPKTISTNKTEANNQFLAPANNSKKKNTGAIPKAELRQNHENEKLTPAVQKKYVKRDETKLSEISDTTLEKVKPVESDNSIFLDCDNEKPDNSKAVTTTDLPNVPIILEPENIPKKEVQTLQEKTGEDKKAEIIKVDKNEVKEEKLEVASPSALQITKAPTPRRPVKEEAAARPLIATPRPLQKKTPQIIHSSSSSESSSEEESSDEDADESDASEDSAEFFECENNPDGRTSTGSNDSGFDSSAPASPAGFVHIKKDCDVNCHRKCEKLTANLCGVNQRLLVEALATRTSFKRGGESAGATASAPAQSNAADILEQELEQSTAYGLFRKTGRFTPPARSIPRFRKYNIDDFHFIKVLGKGSFGKVLLAELRDTEYYYAVKCLKKDVVLEDDDVECTLIERKVLALGTNHPYLCHLFATFQTDSHLFFVMEYLNGGDLMFHIQQSGRFPESRAKFYAAEIVSGLKFLHKRGIVYRDLKLDNILLDFDGHVRIADFGMCKLQIYLEKTADTFCGTPDYMAPEIIKGLKYNQTVDWWSFGVLLYEMLIGQSPFSGCDEDELFWSICNEMPSYPRFLSTEALTILTRLLDKDASTRLGGAECMAGDVRDQDFFHSVHWERLERRELEAPFRPRVRHPLDTQYFDRAFTGERPRLTAVEPQVLRSMDQEPFRGFSYTNPNATDR